MALFCYSHPGLGLAGLAGRGQVLFCTGLDPKTWKKLSSVKNETPNGTLKTSRIYLQTIMVLRPEGDPLRRVRV